MSPMLPGVPWVCRECGKTWTITEDEASNRPGTLNPKCADCAHEKWSRILDEATALEEDRGIFEVFGLSGTTLLIDFLAEYVSVSPNDDEIERLRRVCSHRKVHRVIFDLSRVRTMTGSWFRLIAPLGKLRGLSPMLREVLEIRNISWEEADE